MRVMNEKGQFMVGMILAGIGVIVLMMLAFTVVPFYNSFIDVHLMELSDMPNFYIFGTLLAAIPIILVLAGGIKIYEAFVRPGQ